MLPWKAGVFRLNWLINKRKFRKHRPLDYIIADKLLVRDWVSLKIGNASLIPLIDVCDKSTLLNLDNYSFPIVIKTTHFSGFVIVARNREDITDGSLIELDKLLKINYYHKTLENQYKYIKPRIIVEKCLLDKNGKLPIDYKIHCIKGEPVLIYCSIDRQGLNYRKIYNIFWEQIDMSWAPEDKANNTFGPDIPRPKMLNKMYDICRILSRRSDYCRIDLYEIDDHIYFGEFTHYHGGGLDIISPIKFDNLLGAMIID